MTGIYTGISFDFNIKEIFSLEYTIEFRYYKPDLYRPWAHDTGKACNRILNICMLKVQVYAV